MNMIQAVEQLQDHVPPAARPTGQPRQRLHRIRAGRVVLATGAIERPLVFGNNDLPGILTAAAITTYLNRYAVACGKRVLILTSNDHAYQGACDLAQSGSSVVLVDTREKISPERDTALPMRSAAGRCAGLSSSSSMPSAMP
jgi:sarcosine oxidase subunit alpha